MTLVPVLIWKLPAQEIFSRIKYSVGCSSRKSWKLPTQEIFKMLLSTCLIIFISASTAKESKDKRSVGKLCAIYLIETWARLNKLKLVCKLRNYSNFISEELPRNPKKLSDEIDQHSYDVLVENYTEEDLEELFLEEFDIDLSSYDDVNGKNWKNENISQRLQIFCSKMRH